MRGVNGQANSRQKQRVMKQHCLESEGMAGRGSAPPPTNTAQTMHAQEKLENARYYGRKDWYDKS